MALSTPTGERVTSLTKTLKTHIASSCLSHGGDAVLDGQTQKGSVLPGSVAGIEGGGRTLASTTTERQTKKDLPKQPIIGKESEWICRQQKGTE